jgi:hypothetical protein
LWNKVKKVAAKKEEDNFWTGFQPKQQPKKNDDFDWGFGDGEKEEKEEKEENHEFWDEGNQYWKQGNDDWFENYEDEPKGRKKESKKAAVVKQSDTSEDDLFKVSDSKQQEKVESNLIFDDCFPSSNEPEPESSSDQTSLLSKLNQLYEEGGVSTKNPEPEPPGDILKPEIPEAIQKKRNNTFLPEVKITGEEFWKKTSTVGPPNNPLSNLPHPQYVAQHSYSPIKQPHSHLLSSNLGPKSGIHDIHKTHSADVCDQKSPGDPGAKLGVDDLIKSTMQNLVSKE